MSVAGRGPLLTSTVLALVGAACGDPAAPVCQFGDLRLSISIADGSTGPWGETGGYSAEGSVEVVSSSPLELVVLDDGVRVRVEGAPAGLLAAGGQYPGRISRSCIEHPYMMGTMFPICSWEVVVRDTDAGRAERTLLLAWVFQPGVRQDPIPGPAHEGVALHHRTDDCSVADGYSCGLRKSLPLVAETASSSLVVGAGTQVSAAELLVGNGHSWTTTGRSCVDQMIGTEGQGFVVRARD